MLYKTSGIVFRLTPYGETSAIVNIFTQDFGLRGYIINGLRSKSSKNKAAIYQPLTLLNLVVYHKESTALMRIKEAHCAYLYHNISTDLRKLSILLFLNEILNKVVKERGDVAQLYSFIKVSLATLDTLKKNVENFHLIFLIKLTRFLGVGTYRIQELYKEQTLNTNEEVIIKQLLIADYTTLIHLTGKERQNILNMLVNFYSFHISPMHTIKSIQVLHEILH